MGATTVNTEYSELSDPADNSDLKISHGARAVVGVGILLFVLSFASFASIFMFIDSDYFGTALPVFMVVGLGFFAGGTLIMCMLCGNSVHRIRNLYISQSQIAREIERRARLAEKQKKRDYRATAISFYEANKNAMLGTPVIPPV